MALSSPLLQEQNGGRTRPGFLGSGNAGSSSARTPASEGLLPLPGLLGLPAAQPAAPAGVPGTTHPTSPTLQPGSRPSGQANDAVLGTLMPLPGATGAAASPAIRPNAALPPATYGDPLPAFGVQTAQPAQPATRPATFPPLATLPAEPGALPASPTQTPSGAQPPQLPATPNIPTPIIHEPGRTTLGSGVPTHSGPSVQPGLPDPVLDPVLLPQGGGAQPGGQPGGQQPTTPGGSQPGTPSGGGSGSGSPSPFDQISDANLQLMLQTLLNPSGFDIAAVQDFLNHQESELNRSADAARGRLGAATAARGTFFGTPYLQGLAGVEGELQRGLGELRSNVALRQAETQQRDRLGALAAAFQLLQGQQGAEQFNAQLAMAMLGLGMQGAPTLGGAQSALGGIPQVQPPSGGGGWGSLLAYYLANQGGGAANPAGTQLNFDPLGIAA